MLEGKNIKFRQYEVYIKGKDRKKKKDVQKDWEGNIV